MSERVCMFVWKRDECGALPLKKTHLCWKHTSSLSQCICLCCHSRCSVYLPCDWFVQRKCTFVSVSHWLENVGSMLMTGNAGCGLCETCQKKRREMCVHVHLSLVSVSSLLFASASLSDAVLIL